MKIGILQPGYLPWLGFFEQVYQVDKFVIFDDVQYTTKDWRSRNRIKTPNGVTWLIVPTHGSQTDIIRDVRIVQDNRWKKKHIKTLEFSYKKAAYYYWLMPDLERIINENFEFLLDLDFELILLVKEKLGIKSKILLSSEFNIRDTEKNAKVLKTVRALGGNYLYDGKSAKNFLDVELLNSNGVEVEFQDYKHPVYPQLWGKFVPYLSAVDLLFNCGPESLDYIVGNKGVKK